MVDSLKEDLRIFVSYRVSLDGDKCKDTGFMGLSKFYKTIRRDYV